MNDLENSSDLLQRYNIDQNNCEKLLTKMLEKIEYGDFYFQLRENETWRLENSIIKIPNFSFDQGFGARAIYGKDTGFAYCSDINDLNLEKFSLMATKIARQGKKSTYKNYTQPIERRSKIYSSMNPIDEVDNSVKINFLHQIDQFAHQASSKVFHVEAALLGGFEEILIITSDNTIQTDIRPFVGVKVKVIVKEGTKSEQGTYSEGGRFTYATLLGEKNAKKIAQAAVDEAITNLSAIEAPVGVMNVVLSAGSSGVLFHESVGHGLEGDLIRKKSSVFQGRIGEKVATNLCTLIDCGLLNEKYGSTQIDDEGVPTQETILIEKGILKGFMYDKLNSKLMNTNSTGNGRRESYSHIPIPRMTNTYLDNGPHHPEEIISSVKRGIIALDFSGGQVDVTSGKFVFSMKRACLIENGKLTAPIKGATLIGDGPTVLNEISMVGCDLKIDFELGMCGKDNQLVPATVGQPTVKVENLTVGGIG